KALVNQQRGHGVPSDEQRRGDDQREPHQHASHRGGVNQPRSGLWILLHRPQEALAAGNGLSLYLSNLTTLSGPPSTWTVSTKRTWRVSVVITSDCVRLPWPKKRTPRRIVPSVTPQAAKMIFFPGASSLVS